MGEIGRIKWNEVVEVFIERRDPDRTGMLSVRINDRRSEMIAYGLFGVMAILTFLSISGSLIHILKSVGR